MRATLLNAPTLLHDRGSRWNIWVNSGSTLPTAAVAGNYIDNLIVGATISSAIGWWANLTDLGTVARLRSRMMCMLGSADPTGTISYSVAEVTTAPAAAGAGFIYTVVSTVVTALSVAAPVRGTAYEGVSPEFTIDPAKKYMLMTTLVGATLPTSVAARATSYIEVR